jgi:hypothetical protein
LVPLLTPPLLRLDNIFKNRSVQSVSEHTFYFFFWPSILVYITYNIYHGVYFNVAPPSIRVHTSRSPCQPLGGVCPDPGSGVLVHLPPGSGQPRTPPTHPPPPTPRVASSPIYVLQARFDFFSDFSVSPFFCPIPSPLLTPFGPDIEFRGRPEDNNHICYYPWPTDHFTSFDYG